MIQEQMLSLTINGFDHSVDREHGSRTNEGRGGQNDACDQVTEPGDVTDSNISAVNYWYDETI
ncbi:hypothetical protein O9992_29500 [Vibrio lentus]|nr:hypothetical protein [Vibrio lentus]